MEKRYILALDQGTTSSRAILFDRNQRLVGSVSREFPQIYPKEGWVEHDPADIWSSQYGCATEVMARCDVSPAEIAAVGITNQRETTVVWERSTGRPVSGAIVWQCRRTAPLVEELTADGWGEIIRDRTGLVPDAYFSATKIRWILDNVPGAREKAEAGELCFGTVDSWLLWKLTEGRVHATDRTNASRTMLYNIRENRWDDGLLAHFGVPRSMLPEVKSSSEIYGTTALFGGNTPIAGIAGDQQAALFGQGCFRPGDAKNTYGTGCFLLMNVGTEPRMSENGLLCTVAATAASEPVQYALEGSVFTGGAVTQWLRDEMQFFHDSADIEEMAKSVPDSGGVYLVPAFTGLGAPWWDMYARGTVTGITRGTKRAHIVRAAEESIAYQSADLIAAMERDMGSPIRALRVDGGATRDSFLMQFQADVIGKPVLRPAIRETTALGAAYLAGLATGFWSSRDALTENRQPEEEFVPSITPEKRSALLDGWHEAVGMATAHR
jgi:glycerol kinase